MPRSAQRSTTCIAANLTWASFAQGAQSTDRRCAMHPSKKEKPSGVCTVCHAEIGATLDDVHCGKSNMGVVRPGRTIDRPEVRHASKQEGETEWRLHRVPCRDRRNARRRALRQI